jgi:hypothetical protein
MSIDQDALKQRATALAKENEALTAKVAANEVELHELEIALKVFARYSGDGAPSDGKTSNASEAPDRKPEGTPTMPHMILSVLKELDRPLEPRDITDRIRGRWWPGVESSKVASIVWRMEQRGQLEKIEGTTEYRLPKDTEAPEGDLLAGNPSEASNQHDLTSREAQPSDPVKPWVGGGT